MSRFSADPRSQSTSMAQSAMSSGNGFDDSNGQLNDDDDESADGGGPNEARRLLDEVQRLGSRLRQNRIRAQQIDRRAAAYASRLARHTARLLDHMPDAVPAIKPVPGTGASSLRNYILRHDALENPDRVRFLVVSSDGRLRLCTVVNSGSRLWNDYEVTNPPLGLGLGVVFEGLSALIVRLEGTMAQAEVESQERSASVDNLIAESEAVLFNAGSRLQPMEAPAASEAAETDEEREERERGLRSHGFERQPLQRAGDEADSAGRSSPFSRIKNTI